MSEQEQSRPQVQRTSQGFGSPAGGQGQEQVQRQTSESDASFDALLDQIDAVLETNAEEYVRSFVQKGGQ
ncbi:ubiquitin-like protein Pup [Aestuariimicrobium soli]|uniref:ubiquitin-like protein Pup n=1 Tax=Aestuariimicrobium soli TaxID=2035834 RepID=UPI003EBD8C5F